MSIHKKLKQEIPDALRARDKERLRVVRNLLAALTNELVKKGKKPSEELSDEDALVVIKQLSKQRKDSIEQFKKGGREDLVEPEERELAYLMRFLPEGMGEEEIRAIALKKKDELGVRDKTGMGALMGAVMKETKGRADGGVVKKVVEGLLM